jgi:hypothetical protein
MSQYGPTENAINGTPSHPPAFPMMTGWFWNGIDRNCEKAHPRLNPDWTSHHVHPLMQPITFTCAPPGTHATNGKLASGPARRFIACVVNAGCAQAAAGSSTAATISTRTSERARVEKFCMESIRHKASKRFNAAGLRSVYAVTRDHRR